MNPVGKAKSEVKGVFAFVKAHWIGALLFGMVFAVFLFPRIARFLGGLKAKGGVWDKVIPGVFTA